MIKRTEAPPRQLHKTPHWRPLSRTGAAFWDAELEKLENPVFSRNLLKKLMGNRPINGVQKERDKAKNNGEFNIFNAKLIQLNWGDIQQGHVCLPGNLALGTPQGKNPTPIASLDGVRHFGTH